MAYLGNTPQTQSFTPAIDYFNGTGATTAFTLSRPVASVAQVQVVVENVPQNPSSAYTVSGQTITFTSAPPSGTNNIYVEYTSPITQYNALSQSPVVYGNLNFGSTGARITGDFSNAPVANRVSFQTSTTNNSTNLQVIPNGTSQQSAIDLNGSSAVTNQARFTIRIQSDEATIRSAIDGTGSYLPMTFYTGGSERMRIDTSGNVGIGTSSVAERLTVSGNIRIEGSNQIQLYDSNYFIRAVTGLELQSADLIRFLTNGANERMRIDSSGNVGIGTSSPSQKLTVYSASGDNRIRMESAASVNTGIQMVSTAGTGYFDYNNQNFIWNTNGSERMRLDTSGQNTMTTTIGYAQLRNVTSTVVATGGTVDFPNMSGILIVNNWTQGTVVIFSCGGGLVSTVNTNGLYPGTVAYQSVINGYRWTANSPAGTTHTYSFTLIATRPAA